VSWLFFNTRVLEEAENPDVPLLERVRFLSISASNLDEFYMVRVAGLREQVRAGIHSKDSSHLSPAAQLEKINKRAAKIVIRQNRCWRALQKELSDSQMNVLRVKSLSEEQTYELRDTFKKTILPLLTPLAVDPAHPFPFLSNLGFGIALRLEKEGKDPLFGLITVPVSVPRFVDVETGGKGCGFVLIEDVLRTFSQEIYPDFNVTESGVFRITRDSGIAIDERAEDLVQHFEKLLRKRRRGRVIRLEINKKMKPALREFLINSFDCADETIEEAADILGLRDMSELVKSAKAKQLFPTFKARFPERIREFDGDCLAAIAAKDILVHHPYEEFDVVVQFLQQAAVDPNVVAIKQTLYRTSDDSPIVQALIDAADAGKTVTALDAKVSLVIRQEQGELKTYTHLGTGNYHVLNAKIYTDLALFTADKAIGEDVGKLFNFVTSYNEPKDLKKLSIAPLSLRETLEKHIDAEIHYARAGRPSHIWAKMNALVDPKMIEEHSRIICFGNGAPLPSDQALVFISSADWMPRNLNRRVETLVPVESPTVHNQVLDQIMMANLLDNTNSWELQATGRYVRVTPEEGVSRFSAHEYFMENPSLSGRGAALDISAPASLENSDVPPTQIFHPKLVS